MRLLPNTLMGRTALLLALLIILSQVAWFGIVRLFFIQTLRAAHADPVVSTVVMAQSALANLPPDKRRIFLADFGKQQGLRIVPADAAAVEFAGANEKLPHELVHSLRRAVGSDVLFKATPRTHELWVRFPAGGQMYWLVLPRNRIGPLFPLDLLIWVALGLVIAMLGAWLVIFRLNRHLRRVLEAARRLGRGETPAKLPETGPEEIRELSRGFNQMAEGLNKLDAERRLMLAGISHDLRTPLTRLRLGVELQGKSGDPALAIGMVRDIEDMDAILAQFLDYARDGSEEAASVGDLNQIVFDVCHRYSVGGARIQPQLGNLPAFAFRKLAMHRLITNLVDNAVRYGGREVEVLTEPAGKAVRLTVADRGPGIRQVPPQILLQPFARGDAARGEKRGAGLGLTIAERIARTHGGRLALDNRAGGGLRVCVELPCA